MPEAHALAPQLPEVRQLEPQQKPPRQAPEGHWAFEVQAAPTPAIGRHWPEPLQKLPAAQSVSEVQVVLQAAPLQR